MEFEIRFTFTTDEAAMVLDDVIGMVIEDHDLPNLFSVDMRPEKVDLVAAKAIALFDSEDFSHKRALLLELLAQALIAVAEERSGL